MARGIEYGSINTILSASDGVRLSKNADFSEGKKKENMRKY